MQKEKVMKLSFKKIAKYFFVVLFTIAGLLYLNNVIAQLWLVGGPPTTDLDTHRKIAFWHSLVSVLFFILAAVTSRIRLREVK